MIASVGLFSKFTLILFIPIALTALGLLGFALLLGLRFRHLGLVWQLLRPDSIEDSTEGCLELAAGLAGSERETFPGDMIGSSPLRGEVLRSRLPPARFLAVLRACRPTVQWQAAAR